MYDSKDNETDQKEVGGFSEREAKRKRAEASKAKKKQWPKKNSFKNSEDWVDA
jgi:hypothetical protein